MDGLRLDHRAAHAGIHSSEPYSKPQPGRVRVLSNPRQSEESHGSAGASPSQLAFAVLGISLAPDLVAGRQFVLNVNRESKYAVPDRLSTQRPDLGVDLVFAVYSGIKRYGNID